MSDRISGFVVTLERDWRDDEAGDVRRALAQIRGVADISQHIAEQRAKDAYRTAMYEALAKL